MRFFSFSLLIGAGALLGHVYLYRRLVRHVAPSLAWRRAIGALLAVMTLALMLRGPIQRARGRRSATTIRSSRTGGWRWWCACSSRWSSAISCDSASPYTRGCGPRARRSTRHAVSSSLARCRAASRWAVACSRATASIGPSPRPRSPSSPCTSRSCPARSTGCRSCSSPTSTSARSSGADSSTRSWPKRMRCVPMSW